MSNKQSNKQTQNVKVVVNNNLKNCCDKPKPKRRKPQRKPQEEQPIDEFPPLYTPPARNGAPSISALPNRNSVYIPPTIQISNSAYPVPSYFESHYTNLTRTLEDFANLIRKEQQDVDNLVNNDTNQEASQLSMSEPQVTPQPTMTPYLTKYDVRQDEDLASTSRTPVKQLTKVFEPEVLNSPSTPQTAKSSIPTTTTDTMEIKGDALSSRKQLEKERRFYFTSEKFTDEDIDNLYNKYLIKYEIKKQGRPVKKRLTQINHILAYEKMYGRLTP